MATTYTFTKIYRTEFKDKSGLTITDNRQLAAATFTPTNGAAIQSPRLAANVTLQTGAGTTSDPSTYLRCWMRPAPSGTAPAAGWPSPWSGADPPFSACKFQVTAPGTIQTYGRYIWRTRRDSTGDGTNNKGVAAILWPNKGGWSNPAANESDILEFWQYPGSEDVHNMSTNLHWKDSSGKEQQKTNIGNIKALFIDWTQWHTCQLDWTPTYMKLWIDGTLVWTVTGTTMVPTIPMWFGCQLAFLGVNHGATRDNGWVDFDWLEVYKLDQGSNIDTTPAAPVIQSVTGVSQTTNHVVWSQSTNSQGTPAASYQLTHSSTQNGTYSNVGTPTTRLSGDDSTLSASTTEWYKAIAIGSDGKTSDPSDPVSGTTLPDNSANPPTANLVASPLSGYAPLDVTFDPTATTGSPTSMVLDPGDGSAPQTITGPVVYTYTAPGSYTAILTATNANGSDTDQAAIQVGQVVTNPPVVTLFPATKGAAIKADDYNANNDAIQAALNNAAQSVGGYNDPSTIVLSSQVSGETYPRWVLLANGDMFMGDGTFDPTTATPIFGPDATVAPPTQPSTTESFTWAVSNSASAASTSPTLTLPAGVVASTLAIAAVMVKNNSTTVATPSGWTLLQTVSNGNGNAMLKVYSKVVGSTDSSTTITFTLGTSALWATAMVAYLNCTAVDTSDKVANSTSASTTLATPAVTTAASAEYVVSISGCRFATSGSPSISPAAGYNDRAGATSSGSSTNNVSLEIFDTPQTASGASAAPAATTGTGCFSVGVTVALAHA